MSALSSKLDCSKQFDASRPMLPPRHFSNLLQNVPSKQNYLDLGMETGQNFFSLYHEFSGQIVGLELNPGHTEFVRSKAEKILPKYALNRSQIIGGSQDILQLALQLKNKFDLVTVGDQVKNFGNPDNFFQFVKEKLLTEDGTLALTSKIPESVEFNTCYDDKENVEIQKDFQNLQEYLQEYMILPNNPYFNQGVHLRHFSRSQKVEEKVQNVIEANDFISYIRTIPAYNKYMKDESQVDKYALNTFQRKLNSQIAKRSANMTSQQSLIKISQKVITFLLKK